MPRRVDDRSASRTTSRLSREGIVSAAVALADEDGLAALSMRKLAQHLGVDAMSIYYHLRDKDALLAAMADAVVAEIDAAPVAAGATSPADSPSAGPWTTQLRSLIMQARQTMLRHPWAAKIFTDRDEPTPAVLLHIERVLAVMRGGGCSVDLCHHAIHLLGSRILGFSQDLFDDSPDNQPTPAEAAAQAAAWAAQMPHIAELAGAVSHSGTLGACDDDEEFAFALDLLLDGLERQRRTP